jgi:hypothetical protein
LHKTHWCRFNALFRLIGAPRVHSHTVKIKVDYRDPRALEIACNNLAWNWHGFGNHHLYDGTYSGHGFTPEGWNYPAVLTNDTMHADTFGGRWGDDAQLDKLRSEYAMASAQLAAQQLGWQCERTERGLTVYHPEGGILTLSNEGICETTGFIGAGCHTAREALGLQADGQAQNKPEFGQTAAQIQAGI